MGIRIYRETFVSEIDEQIIFIRMQEHIADFTKYHSAIGSANTRNGHDYRVQAGERYGKILPGFDVGNSPWELSKMDVNRKTVVHTTSAGTQGVANATGADEILGASLVTAKATAEYIKRSGAKQVSLVCMGNLAISEAEEDTLCAEYIRGLLLGEQMDMAKEIQQLKETAGAKFFDEKQKDVFPEKDFYMCTELDKFDFVLRLRKDSDGMNYIEKG